MLLLLKVLYRISNECRLFGRRCGTQIRVRFVPPPTQYSMSEEHCYKTTNIASVMKRLLSHGIISRLQELDISQVGAYQV